MQSRISGIACVGCLAVLASLVPSTIARNDGFDHYAGSGLVKPTPSEKAPAFLYKGIAIGTPADDVRKKLGDPKDKSDAQDLFVFSDEESAQFMYDADKKVTAIMITFSGKLTGAPTPKDVFGEDVPAKADGGVFKMVRYPKAGYWISYNKIVGDDSMISIAMQKI